MDLLDEIENDPEFIGVAVPATENLLKILAREIEAIILVLNAKGIMTEKEYQMALQHLDNDAKKIVEYNVELDYEFVVDSTQRFRDLLEGQL